MKIVKNVLMHGSKDSKESLDLPLGRYSQRFQSEAPIVAQLK